MSTRARKDRKKAGIKFSKPAKTPTPPEERSFMTQPVNGPGGTRWAAYQQPRSLKSRMKFLEKFSKADPISEDA